MVAVAVVQEVVTHREEPTARASRVTREVEAETQDHKDHLDQEEVVVEPRLY